MSCRTRSLSSASCSASRSKNIRNWPHETFPLNPKISLVVGGTGPSTNSSWILLAPTCFTPLSGSNSKLRVCGTSQRTDHSYFFLKLGNKHVVRGLFLHPWHWLTEHAVSLRKCTVGARALVSRCQTCSLRMCADTHHASISSNAFEAAKPRDWPTPKATQLRITREGHRDTDVTFTKKCGSEPDVKPQNPATTLQEIVTAVAQRAPSPSISALHKLDFTKHMGAHIP